MTRVGAAISTSRSSTLCDGRHSTAALRPVEGMRAKAAARMASTSSPKPGPATAVRTSTAMSAGGEARVEGRQAGGSPGGRVGAVESERRAGVGENHAAHPVGVVKRGVQGVHAAEGLADQMGPVHTRGVQQPGDGVGDGREGQRLDRR